MNPYKKFIIPLILILSTLLSSCEIDRFDSSGEIAPVQPIGRVTTEAGQTAPETVPAEGQPPPDTPPLPADISTEQFPAPLAPAATPIEGKVLVKLEQQAAIQARSAELGSDQVVSAGLPSLDQVLRDIGASELQPVVEEVVEATGDTLEGFSVQAEEAVQLYSVTFDPSRDPVEVAELLEQDPTVEYAEPDYMAGITARPVYVPVLLEPNDPYFKYQWNFAAIQAPAAWDKSTGQGVIVAIIDTGIDFNTPDLANTQRLPGYDFANKDPDSTDDQGHGTHVAGTIAQSTNNSLGVAGVAYNAHLLPVKVLGANGQGSYEGIIQGIYFAVDQGAKVINMSLAGRAGSQALQEAVQHAHQKGVVVVAAAGNSNSSVEFPAAYDDYVIAVGSSRFDDARAPYSNFGPQIDIVAPGGDVGIDQNGDGFADGILQQTFKPQTPGTYTYLFFEGTSMASPHIAGVAALLLALNPTAPPTDIKNIMMQTARNVGPPEQFGAGLVQARAALDALQGVPPPVVTETPTTAPATQPPPPTTPLPPTAVPPTLPLPTAAPPTPTPAPPPTTPTPPSPPPPAGSNLLTSGDFESEGGWVFGDTPLPGGYDSSVVLSGGRSVRLGTTSGRDAYSFSSIWQRVVIPAEAKQVTLTANIYPVSQDSGGDVQYIAILNDRFRVSRTLYSQLNNTQAWQNLTFDLSDLRGQTIYIYFSVFNRGGTNRPTAMFVDDVSLVWSP